MTCPFFQRGTVGRLPNYPIIFCLRFRFFGHLPRKDHLALVRRTPLMLVVSFPLRKEPLRRRIPANLWGSLMPASQA
jgi:hypothetical protein